MMRKFILSAFLLLSVLKGWSQCSPDNRIGGDLMYPMILDVAMAGYDYHQVITFRVPADSNILYNGNTVHASVDSARVLFISGIPKGYDYACSPSRCTWLGGANGCAVISGRCEKSDTGMIGEYPIKIYVQTWLKVATLSLTRIDSGSSYTFKIRAYNGAFELSPLKQLTVYPNPNQGRFNIELRGLEEQSNSLEIYDASGKMVYHKSFEKPATYLSSQQVNFNPENHGIYLVRLVSGDQVYVSKVLVE